MKKNNAVIKILLYAAVLVVTSFGLFFLCLHERPMGFQVSLFSAIAVCTAGTVLLTGNAYMEAHGQNAAARRIAWTAIFLVMQTGVAMYGIAATHHITDMVVMEGTLYMLYGAVMQRNGKATPEAEF